ncbi:ABC1-domain-containing protein [Hygrophoropsis aurantiaca]|uniref:ABC1-domain-containing protein n=1 Tax=Hygrophoropsis aurantiaca TaxID=72124 RepID=A0ACB8AFP6_9AGAM|nr:ABC1-domain-containing protein [Hygrophoropsis aurantiaca]
MPVGPAYSWLCVAHSIIDITARAAQIQVLRGLPKASSTHLREQAFGRHAPDNRQSPLERPTNTIGLDSAFRDDLSRSSNVDKTPRDIHSAPDNDAIHEYTPLRPGEASSQSSEDLPIAVEFPLRQSSLSDISLLPKADSSALDLDTESRLNPSPQDNTFVIEPTVLPISTKHANVLESVPPRNLQSSKVPSSRIGRLFHYGGLAASLGYGAASEILRRSASSSDTNDSQSSIMMTEANIKRLVSKLSQMRGAALKLGQFMSIQDTHLLPPEVDKIFRRVQDSAHYMPDWQMDEVLTTSLGSSWETNFTSFSRIPFAAASIGQVHHAILSASSSPTGKEEAVAVKIQFPNIANSIASDLGYVKMLLTAGRLLPKGLFLDKTIQVMKAELADECDYSREASFLQRYGSPDYLGLDSRFKVPWVWSGSTDRVLVMEHVDGASVGEAAVANISQDERNEIASRIIELCLRELFQFRLMQTDPNWTNFLWNSAARQVSLVDFGATREYSKEFMDNWLRLLQAAAQEDRDACIDSSLRLGYLTGEENEVMLTAHVNSMTLIATPFRASTPQPFAFGPGSQWADITAQIRSQIPIMLQHRLTPPPPETYSLNRKLSGAFLLASRLSAVVDTKALWDKTVASYRFD